MHRPGYARKIAANACFTTSHSPSMRARAKICRSLALACGDAIEMPLGANQQAAAGDGRRGHAHLVQAVLPHQLVVRARLDDEGVAVLTEAEDLAVVGPGR